MKSSSITFAILILASSGIAQEFRATLQGTATDPAKATIPGAALTLRNSGTGVERKASTDSVGHYIFQFLPPGGYTLTTKAPGFKTDVRESVQLSLGDNLRLDVELALGQTNETVTVTGEVSAVQAESSSLGSVLGRKVVDTLPLKGHSSLFMFTLATGVVNNRYGEDTRPNDTITNVSYSSNGSPVASGDVSVDGVANTVNVNRGVNISQWVPQTDAVAEFKLQTGTLPAEYGRSGGNIMNIVIRSGTNELHGTAYEYLRNSALDANLFYNNSAGRSLAPYTSHTYGLSVGGPVWLPKIYNGKNKTFFFFNFEGSREGNGISPVLSVPTEKMRAGDFSESPAVIYNPFSVRSVNGVPTRDPFPNRIIPQNLQDPVARNMMNYWPKPNIVGPDPARPFVQNFSQSFKWPRDYDATVIKIDHTFNPNHQMFGRLNFGEGRLIFPHRFDGVATGGRNNVKRPNFGIALSDTHILSPTTTFDVRIGYARGVENNRPWSDGFDLAALGFPASYQNLVQTKAFPTLNVSDFEGLAGSGYIFDPGHTWSLQPSVTMQRNKHLLKYGGEVRLSRGNYFRNLNPSGTYSFGPNQTGGPNAATPSAGFGLASFLVGFGSGNMPFNTGVSIQNVYYALYLQDDFRVSSRLTLNLGLRWEYETPRTERYNRTTRGFAYPVPSPIKVPGLDLRGGLLYAGVGGAPRGIYDQDRNNFAPRIGFAFSLNRKTILRGGYALSYIPVIGSVQSIGFSNDTPWVSSTDGGISVLNRFSNPFPTGLLAPIGNSQALATLTGQAITFVEPSGIYPKFHNWQFNLQRELPGQALVEVAYVGSRGINLIAPTETLNQLDPGFLSLGAAALNQTVPNPFFGIFTTGALSGATVQRNQLLRPYPHFTSVSRSDPAFGNSIYHSLQFRVEKRTSQGLTGLISYTISKNITDLSTPQNAYNRAVERAVSDFDVPQRLTIAGAYDLPVGKGRRYMAGASRAADLLLGQWQLSTFITFQGGFPTAYGVQGGTGVPGSARRGPNVVGDPTTGPSGSHSTRLDRYFNTDAFARPLDFTFGNLAARLHSVRTPGMNNLNLTVSKAFQIVEKVKLEFRASSYNMLNHPVFGGPNTTVGNASFGRISSQANISRQWEFALRLQF